MPSDLNLKKSWNPQLMKNREKVWEKEREILEQYKKAQEHKAKLHEINEKNELLELAKDSTTTSKDEKLKPKDLKTSWMYQSTNVEKDADGNKIDTDILLGKRRLDSVIKDQKNNVKVSRLDKVLGVGSAGKGSISNDKIVPKEAEKLSKSDPLYVIKLQQQKQKEQLERQKKAAAERKEKDRSHRHKSHRDRSHGENSHRSKHESSRHRHSHTHRHRNENDTKESFRDRDPRRRDHQTFYRNRDD